MSLFYYLFGTPTIDPTHARLIAALLHSGNVGVLLLYYLREKGTGAERLGAGGAPLPLCGFRHFV